MLRQFESSAAAAGGDPNLGSKVVRARKSPPNCPVLERVTHQSLILMLIRNKTSRPSLA